MLEDPEKTQPIAEQPEQGIEMDIPPGLRYGIDDAPFEDASEGILPKKRMRGEALSREVRAAMKGHMLHDRVNDRDYVFAGVELNEGEHFGKLRFKQVVDGAEADEFTLLSERDLSWNREGELVLGEGWELLEVLEADEDSVGESVEELMERVKSTEEKSPGDIEKLTASFKKALRGASIKSTGDYREYEFVEAVFSSDEDYPYKLMFHLADGDGGEDDVFRVVSPDEFSEQFRVEAPNA